jgi:hypothetical protein
MHDSAGRSFDFRSRFAHLDASDSLDLLPQRVAGDAKQLSVKDLYLSRAGRAPDQGLLNSVS